MDPSPPARTASNVSPAQRTKERIGGLFLLVVGGGVAVWTWRSAATDGTFSAKAALLGPAFAVFGLALLVIPGYRTERLARGEDLTALTSFAIITPRWWAVVALALAMGTANVGLLLGWWGADSSLRRAATSHPWREFASIAPNTHARSGLD